MAGRPTKYNDELGQKLHDAIATSVRGIKSIAKENGISHITMMEWIKDKEHPFSTLYARAKEIQKQNIADDMLEIADNTANDLIAGQFGDMPNQAAIQRAKLQIDTRKWLLSKLDPKKYGDKIEHSGNVDVVVTGMKIV